MMLASIVAFAEMYISMQDAPLAALDVVHSVFGECCVALFRKEERVSLSFRLYSTIEFVVHVMPYK